MSGLFAYFRVAPGNEPNATAQWRQVAAAGFAVLSDNVTVEVAAASVAVRVRPGWQRLLDWLHEGDVLVVTTLDGLGRDVRDVCATLAQLVGMGVRVHCLALGTANLSGAEGKSVRDVLAALAGWEQARQTEPERLGAGMGGGSGKAIAMGRRKGRPPSLSAAQVGEARKLMAAGVSVVQIARGLQTSRQTVMRLRARKAMGSVKKEAVQKTAL